MFKDRKYAHIFAELCPGFLSTLYWLMVVLIHWGQYLNQYNTFFPFELLSSVIVTPQKKYKDHFRNRKKKKKDTQLHKRGLHVTHQLQKIVK